MVKPSKIGIIPLAMINVAAIISLKNFSMAAEYGSSLILYFLVVSLIFFIPTSLVSAELATTYPETGGVYIWVKRALGDKWGFIAIWLQWIENVIWYPTILSFAAATLAYAFNPNLAVNKIYMTSVILVSFWGFTFLNFLGMKASSLISTFGVVLGTLIPGIIILFFGIYYFFQQEPIQISWNIMPEFSLDNMIFVSGLLLCLAGMEMSAVHAKEVKNPAKDYPKAIFLSMAIILILSVLGSLAIAIVVPKTELSLVAGMMQAFEVFFNIYHIPWMSKIIALLAACGAFSMVSTWIIGPSKGLMITASSGDLPPILQKKNKHNTPVALLLFQAIIATLLSLIFLFMPNVSSSYWLLSALTAQLYLIMYILVFLSAIILRKKEPMVTRPYKAPFLKTQSIVGILGSMFAIVMGFFPPKGFEIVHVMSYIAFLVVGIVVFCFVPIIVLKFKKPHWTH